jgi:hypothetical protein
VIPGRNLYQMGKCFDNMALIEIISFHCCFRARLFSTA